jgi:sulfonate transport system ATP-binding protein
VNQVESVLAGRDLQRSFGNRSVLRGASLQVGPEEFICLLGRSGAGKTVLLRILAGLDADFTGQVDASAPVGLMFQDARLVPWMRVGANVALGVGHLGAARVEEALGEVGLAGRADAWPRELSTGEAQRAALARTLLRNPGIVLLDEPFSALDAFTRAEMQALLHRVIRRRGASALLVTHDLDEALALGDRVAVLTEGTILHEVVVRPSATQEALARMRSQLLDWLFLEAPSGSLMSGRHTHASETVQRRGGWPARPAPVDLTKDMS